MKRKDRRDLDVLVCVSGKTGFRNEDTATTALEKARENPRRHGAPVRVYRCHLCPWWHLTSRPARLPKGLAS